MKHQNFVYKIRSCYIILLVLCLVEKISVICVTDPSYWQVYYVIFTAISEKNNSIEYNNKILPFNFIQLLQLSFHLLFTCILGIY